LDVLPNTGVTRPGEKRLHDFEEGIRLRGEEKGEKGKPVRLETPTLEKLARGEPLLN